MADQVRIFVSHSHKDNEFTSRLVADLRTAGADVWVDTAEITYDDLIKRIDEGLSGRQWLVLVMSPDALRSNYVRMEVNAALNRVMKDAMQGVIPVVARACRDDEIPPTWDVLHRYDATQDYALAFARLVRAIGLQPPTQTSAQPRVREPKSEPSKSDSTTGDLGSFQISSSSCSGVVLVRLLDSSVAQT